MFLQFPASPLYPEYIPESSFLPEEALPYLYPYGCSFLRPGQAGNKGPFFCHIFFCFPFFSLIFPSYSRSLYFRSGNLSIFIISAIFSVFNVFSDTIKLPDSPDLSGIRKSASSCTYGGILFYGVLYFFVIYPFAFKVSAQRIAPPAAPLTVL